MLQWGDQPALITIAQACLSLREYEEARERLLQAQRPSDSAMTVWRQNYTASILYWLARVDFQQGNLERAQGYCRESMREAERIPDFDLIAQNLALAAAIAATQGQATRAARLISAALTLAAGQGRKLLENSSLDTLLPGWSDGPDAAALTAAFEAGQAMNVDQAMAYALSDVDP